MKSYSFNAHSSLFSRGGGLKTVLILFFFLPLTVFSQKAPTNSCECITVGTGTQYTSLSTYLLHTMQQLPLKGPGPCILVKGTFRIDVSPSGFGHTFMDMNIFMDTDSKLLVAPGEKLSIQGSSLTPCDDFWQGIQLSNNSTVDLETSNIQYAKRAIYGDDLKNASVFVYNSTFLNNIEGIAFSGLVDLEFAGKVQFMSPDLTISQIGPHGQGTLGIYMKEDNDLFTSSSNLEFSDLNFGIYLSGCSNYQLIGDSYKNIGSDGVYSVDCGDLFVEQCEMFNVGKGIYGITNRGRFHIKRCNITSKNQSIHIIAHHFSTQFFNGIQVNDNWGLFSEKKSCIEIDETVFSGSVDIYNNINLHPGYGNLSKPSQAIGILVKGVYNKSFLGISRNKDIYLGGSGDAKRTGILVLNCDAANQSQVNENTIQSSSKDNGYGIHIVNSPTLEVVSNEINGSASNMLAIPQAIRIENSAKTHLDCNEPNNTSRGLSFAMANPSSLVQATSYGNHLTGMFYEFGSITNEQFHTGNDWSAASTVYDGYLQGDGFSGQLNSYKISPNKLRGNNSVFFLTSGSEPDWISRISGNELACLEFGTISPTQAQIGVSSTALQYAVNQSVESYERASQLEFQKYLWKEIQQDPILVNSQDWAVFDQHISNSSLSDFVYIHDLLSNVGDLVDISSIQELTAILLDLNDDYVALKEGNASNELLELKSDEIITAQVELNTAKSALNDAMDAQLYQILAFNSAIETDDELLLLEKQINNYLIQSKKSEFEGFSELEKAVISNMANLCPVLYGQAVYKARGLEMGYGVYTDYAESDNCVIEEREGRQNNVSDIGCAIHPNPVSDYVQISLLNSAKEYQIEIFDTSGGEVYSVTHSGIETLQISTTSYQEGIFFLKITNGETQLVKKIIKL